MKTNQARTCFITGTRKGNYYHHQYFTHLQTLMKYRYMFRSHATYWHKNVLEDSDHYSNMVFFTPNNPEFQDLNQASLDYTVRQMS